MEQQIQIPASFRKTAIALALASTPLMAQDLVLEEVIVTAQKRTESVQDIAATVNVVSGADLEKFATFSFGDIEQQTAGLTLSTPNARSSSISMRGVGNDPESGVAAAVDPYWNDLVVRADIAFSQLYDLARVEILRGPQGTLQGRTSPAGAIKIVTKMPDLNEAEGFVQLTASDDDGFNGQIAYGAPLVEDKFAMRVAALYDQNNSNDVTNLTTGQDNPEASSYSGRLSAVWQVTDKLNAQLAYQYLDRDTDDPKAMAGVDPLGERPSLDAQDRKALGPTTDYGQIEFDLAALTLTWNVGEFEITSVTGFVDSVKKAGTENDRAHYATNPEQLTNQGTRTDADSLTQELRLASSATDFWDYMVGVYYFDQETTTKFRANASIFPTGLSFVTEGDLPVNSSEIGIFTFNTFTLDEQWMVELGLRYTDYDRDRKADIFFDSLNYVPPGLSGFRDLIQQDFESRFPIVGVGKKNQNSREDAFTGSLKLRYEWRDDISLYASYSRGYRPSGISIVPSPNIAFLPNGENDLLHDEETSDSVEVGFKSRLVDGRATLNGALYHVQYDGFLGFVRGVQVLDDLGEAVDLPGGIIYNGDANVWGLDLEGQILLTQNWSMSATATYVHSEWDNAQAPCNDREAGEVLGSCDIDGEAISGEPEYSASLQTEYSFPLESTELYVRALYKYTDSRANQEASAGLGAVEAEFDATNIVNLYGGWRSSNYSWDVFGWAKNVFDEDKVTFQQGPDQYDIALSGGSYTQTNILKARSIGVTARYNF